MNFFSRVLENKVLMIALVSWTVAQGSKVLIEILSYRKVDLKRFVGSGGMPSSHSAFVMALSTGIGKLEGWESPLFAIALSFAFVVMYDAAGVRRAAGKQAEILNIIIKDMVEHKVLKEERLKELIGHTPIEVIIGGIIGVITANIMV
ncbi:MAG: divergent PAP2 family protein [Clostridiales bacterium]|nr:divergent PAP2 family protein [Clostridiales bacterium]